MLRGSAGPRPPGRPAPSIRSTIVAARHVALDDEGRGDIPVRVEAAALLQVGDERERFGGGARLALALGGEVVVALAGFDVVAEVEAAGHHPDGTGSVLDGGDGSGRSGSTGGRQREPGPEYLVGPGLEVEVDGGGDDQAALESLLQLAFHVVGRAPEDRNEPILGGGAEDGIELGIVEEGSHR